MGLKKCEEWGKKEKKGLTTPFLDGIYQLFSVFTRYFTQGWAATKKIDHHEFIGEGGDEKDLTGQHRWQTIPGKGGDETATFKGKWLNIVN